MIFFNNIKVRIGDIILTQRYRKLERKNKLYNFDTARNIGIIFNATQLEMYEKTKSLIKPLTDKGINVMALGFVDSKYVLDYYTYVKGFNFFSKKNLNWYGKPVNPIVDEFIKREFDILIDMSLEDYFPVHYIAALSKARFKVGWYVTKNSYYDLMIDISANKNLDFYISQINHYMAMLK